jgi:glycosyltransferase involved in cell wall biosynthesis
MVENKIDSAVTTDRQSSGSFSSAAKPMVLAFIGNYLPGYKAGGILRITVNTVDHMCDEFAFKIVTRDRDLGDDQPYPDIKLNEWQQVGNAQVYYLSSQSETLRDIHNLIADTPHDMLYLNSFFDSFTIKVLLNRILHKKNFKPVIVAPWGEFGWASLKQKYPKKFVFIQLARLLGLYDNVTWRASSAFEAADIIKVMGIESAAIHITEDLPIKNVSQAADDLYRTDCDFLRIVFLSRISREKNLDYALNVLKKVKAKVAFDIYGPAENVLYWDECRQLISQMPSNVKVNYMGRVDSGEVVKIFSGYDLFLFPTGGEAYGHVIAECLTAGTPVLLSTETPWRNLQEDGLGWDIDLKQQDSFIDVIENLALANSDECIRRRKKIKMKIVERLLDPRILETNRQLFKKQLAN